MTGVQTCALPIYVVTETSSTTEQRVDTATTSRMDTAITTGGWTETAVTVTTVQQNDREWEVTWEKNYTYPDPEGPDTPETPDVPDTPETPEQPETPDTPEEPKVPDIPKEEPPVEDVPETDVPKTDIPTETPDEPLVVIPDEEVPVADVPKTGDDSGLWYLLLAVSLAGLAVMGCVEIRDRKKTTVD